MILLRFSKVFFACMVLMFCGSLNSYGHDKISLHLDGTFLSRFVWRGEMWTDDPVFWHTATIRYGGFRSYNFYNVDLTDINNDRYKCNEYDFILDYTFSFDSVSIAPGVLHFYSPTDFFEPTTKITLQIKTELPMSPGLRIRIDTKKSRGSYFILDVSQSFSLDRVIIDFYGSLGVSQPRYYRKYLGKKTKLTDLLLGLSIPFDIGSGFVLAPIVEFTSLIESSVRKVQDEHNYDKDAFTYGLRLERGFEF